MDRHTSKYLHVLGLTLLSWFLLVSALDLPHYIILMDKTKTPALLSECKQLYSSSVTKLIHIYNTAFNGFSAHMTPTQVAAVQKMPGFVAMFEDQLMELHTTRTPEFLSLTSSSGIWPQTDFGNDVIIGVVDSGIWPESPSFRDTDLGPVPQKWKGICQPGAEFNSSHCNKKLIGARYYFQGYEAAFEDLNWTTDYRSARDSDGHGTHTASIAAGSIVPNASFFGLAQGTARGMAPKARIAIYKVCWGDRKFGCYYSDMFAAISQAVADGVDIISISLGDDRDLPYANDLIAIATFAAMKHGVFVSASAGNSGPKLGTVDNATPWITSVGAGTVDRSFDASMVLGTGDIIQGQSLYAGEGLKNQQFPLVYSSKCDSKSLDPTQVRGKLVLCGRGRSVYLGTVVSKAGGIGLIEPMPLAAGNSIYPISYTLPGIAVTYAKGIELEKYINSTTLPSATLSFTGTYIGSKPAPQVVYFSSRGPSRVNPDVLKPDIIAPGLSILAAWSGTGSPLSVSVDNRRVEYNIDSGTSMACPHISGVAALLKAAHPDWSPAAIRSAIMTTAYSNDNTGSNISDGSTGLFANVFAYGSGHVNPQQALTPGLVYDLAVQDYISFLCAHNYSLSDIATISQTFPVLCPNLTSGIDEFNYPSLTAVFNSISDTESIIFRRKVTNVGDINSTYSATVIAPDGANVTVNPPVLVFSDAHRILGFDVKVRATSMHQNSNFSLASGALIWSDGGRHVIRSPITILFNYHP